MEEETFNPIAATPDDIAGFVGSLPAEKLEITLIEAFLKMKEMQNDVDRVSGYLSEAVAGVEQLVMICKEAKANK